MRPIQRNHPVTAALIAIFLVAAATGTGATDENQTPYAVVDTPQGTLTLTYGELSQMQEGGPTDCGGTAPLVTYCLNAEGAERTGQIGHGCLVQFYTGVVESRLVHAGEDRIVVCEAFSDGTYAFHTEGEWPEPGTLFDHEGYSYFEGTYGHELAPLFAPLSEGDPHGIPGGDGDWSVLLLNG